MAADDQSGKLRRMYGRGFYDGMKAEKLQQAENELSVTARKVLDVVPIQDAWTAQQLMGELQRKGIAIRFDVVMGCIKVLLETKLIREAMKDRFQRTAPKIIPRLASVPQPQEMPMAATPSPKTLIERAEAAAKQLRSLADEVELIALEHDKAMQMNKAETAELQQLSTLIKKLSKGE